jgi:hypothetical protein
VNRYLRGRRGVHSLHAVSSALGERQKRRSDGRIDNATAALAPSQANATLSQSTAVLAQLRCLVGERRMRARRTEFAFWLGHPLSQHEVEPARVFPEQVAG